MITSSVTNRFSKNRAEELGEDVWDDFVVPRFFPSVDLPTATKPRVIIGGRGCGKTMLLKYFSYQSAFSKTRSHFPEESCSNIFLYLRFDTQFLANLHGRGVSDEKWADVFSHYLALVLSRRCLEAVKYIASSNCKNVSDANASKIDYSELSAYGLDFDGRLDSLLAIMRKRLKELSLWASNVGKIAEPVLLPGVSFLKDLVAITKQSISGLGQSNFSVLFDEFENLSESQQEVINGLIKHSEFPLIFHVALKPNGWVTRRTKGGEVLQNIADYRIIDLEAELLKNDFDVFAAEVLTLNLVKSDGVGMSIDINVLRNPDQLQIRNDPEYKSRLLEFGRKNLPFVSLKEVARRSLEIPRVKDRIRKRIALALQRRRSNADADEILENLDPQCALIAPAIFSRPRLPVESVILEFEKYKIGESSKAISWVHNTLMGSILSIYNVYDGVCPVYGGFGSFVTLSSGNLRHFLELCYSYFQEAKTEGLPKGDDFENQMVQARAARAVSGEVVRETRHFGQYGNRLHAFVLRIGALFALAHQHVSQSEPEQNHFVIRGKESEMDQDVVRLISEAVKWSVLFEYEETKIKSGHKGSRASYEYMLNPIYSPAFNTSFRKKRKMEIAYSQFHSIAVGSDEDFRSALTILGKRWTLEEDLEQLALFRNLEK